MFQSLVGFKINWNLAYALGRSSDNLFQSLVGFKINWNIIVKLPDTMGVLFQSLVGFKINWNDRNFCPLGIRHRVSIPSRV
ncbi:hypothetical protein NIES298_19590 [Microcystis aeruginosa NIES-298]|nr:hypothetical protein NIES298_19590 [Microcystis aeruginosa NIES-298]